MTTSPRGAGTVRNGVWVHKSRHDTQSPGPGAYSGQLDTPDCTRSLSPRQVISSSPRWGSSGAAPVLRNGVLLLRGESEAHGAVGPGAYADKIDKMQPLLKRSFNARCRTGNANDSSSSGGSVGLQRSRSFSSCCTSPRGAHNNMFLQAPAAAAAVMCSDTRSSSTARPMLRRSRSFAAGDQTSGNNSSLRSMSSLLQRQLQPATAATERQLSSLRTSLKRSPSAGRMRSPRSSSPHSRYAEEPATAVHTREQQHTSPIAAAGSFRGTQSGSTHAHTDHQQQQQQQQQQQRSSPRSSAAARGAVEPAAAAAAVPAAPLTKQPVSPTTQAQRVAAALKALTGVDSHVPTLMRDHRALLPATVDVAAEYCAPSTVTLQELYKYYGMGLGDSTSNTGSSSQY
jgi:hypothetical protein